MRRKKRGNFQVIFWVILLCALWFFIFHSLPSLIKSTIVYIKETRRVREIGKEIERLTRENKDLRRRIEELKAGKGWEEEARKQGWVKQGEILIKVEGKLPEKKEEKQGLLQKLLKSFEKK
ncbi:MAG: septum formation initiator family protein [bacterium]